MDIEVEGRGVGERQGIEDICFVGLKGGALWGEGHLRGKEEGWVLEEEEGGRRSAELDDSTRSKMTSFQEQKIFLKVSKQKTP